MQPTIPSVSTHLWEDLYDEAHLYQQTAPWTVLDENHIFSIQDPVSEETVYCSILGAVGESYGLIIYRGHLSHEMHWKLKNSLLNTLGTPVRSTYNALILEFCHIEELDKEDRNILKRIGFSLKDRHRYAQFRSYLPGYQSWYLNEKEVESLIFILQAATEYVKKNKENPLFLMASRVEEYFLYLPQKNTSGASWNISEQLPDEETCWVSQEKIQILQAKPQDKDMAWEASIFTGPATVHDRERPYWLQAALIVNRNSQKMLGMDIIKPEDGAIAILLERLIFALDESYYLPSYILFEDLELSNFFSSILNSLNIQSIVISDMAATHKIQRYLKGKMVDPSFFRELRHPKQLFR